jgi:nucleotide-binding universal stress UspA family protein
VVVGVDRSPGAKAALGFAVDEALARDVTLIAEHAYRRTTDRSDRAEDDTALAEGLLADEVLPYARRHPQLKIEMRALESNNIEQTMIESTRDAGLAVVGRRGAGGFAGLLLGSVSRALVHHAYAPVAVVNPTER